MRAHMAEVDGRALGDNDCVLWYNPTLQRNGISMYICTYIRKYVLYVQYVSHRNNWRLNDMGIQHSHTVVTVT